MGASPDTSPEQSHPFLSSQPPRPPHPPQPPRPPHPPQPPRPPHPPRATVPTYGFPTPFPFVDNPPAYLLLPVYPLHRRRRRRCCCCFLQVLSASSSLIAAVFSFLLLACAIFLLWPSDPELSLTRLRLNRFRVAPPPPAKIDIAMGLEIKIRNPSFFAINYSSIVSSLIYRGDLLGSVSTVGGRIAARKVSYVDADLHLDGVRVLEDVIYLIEDVAKGSVEFDTVTEVQGWLRLFFFDVPIKGKISCMTRVNPDDQTISYQDCYPV